MAGPFRPDDTLVRHAEQAARLQRRSVPKQIEYWAELGRYLERDVDHAGLVAIAQGLALADVRPKPFQPVDPDAVAPEEDRADDQPAVGKTRARPVYEVSLSHPGLLAQIDEHGNRTTGLFIDGEFVADTTPPDRGSAPE